MGLAKQRTDFSVRKRRSFEFFSEAWQVLRVSVFLLVASAEKQEMVPRGSSLELGRALLEFASVEVSLIRCPEFL